MDQQPQTSNQIKANPTRQQSQQNTESPAVNNVSQQQQGQQYPQQQVQQDKKLLTPDFIYCTNNKSMDSLQKTYPHLKSLTESSKIDIDAIQQAQSYVIRSNNDDDIHKAIKYGVWSSTPPNNKALGEAYIEAQKTGQDIYLFYSVVKSGQFVGVAKMKSEVTDETFAFWWQHSKWKSHFKIEWLFVKDVTYNHFKDLKNEFDDPVIRSKDGTKIDWEQTGKVMLQTYKEQPEDKNIFEDFAHMDQREQFQRYMRSQKSEEQYNEYQKQQIQQYYQYYYQQQMYGQPQYQQYQQDPKGYNKPYYGQQQYQGKMQQQPRQYNNNNNRGGYQKRPYNNNYQGQNNNNNNYRGGQKPYQKRNYQQRQHNGQQRNDNQQQEQQQE